MRDVVDNIEESQDSDIWALVQKVKELRSEAEEVMIRLQGASHELRVAVRRSRGDYTSRYLIHCNAHLRLAGSILQASKRVAVMDRILDRVREEQVTAQQKEAGLPKIVGKEIQKSVKALEIPREDSFDELYGSIIGTEGSK